MKKYFEYRHSNVQAIDDTVEAGIELARETYEGNKSADYKEKCRLVCENLGSIAIEGSAYEGQWESEKLNLFKNPNVTGSTIVREKFNAVLAQVITAIVPEVTNDQFQDYIAETIQVGFGDTARFTIESNDLFKVNRKAEGVRKGVDQPMFDDEITVHAHPVTVDTAIDWYPFAAGVFDMGKWAVKIARSFAAYIFIKAVKGMTSASSQFGAAYAANGVTPTLWGTLKQRVEAANGGMGVIAIGTDVALSNVSLDGNFQVAIGEEMNKVGYLDQYLGTPLMAVKNALVPGTVNTTADLVLGNNKIFMVPVAGQRPVKILFEGNQVAVTYDPEHTSDVRYGISVELRIGIAAVCGAKYGTITLA